MLRGFLESRVTLTASAARHMLALQAVFTPDTWKRVASNAYYKQVIKRPDPSMAV
jgi:hypothetical protein